MSKNSDDYLIFAAGTLCGVLGGIIVGIVFFPKSGIEMRQNLKNIAKNLVQDMPSDSEKVKNTFCKNIDTLKYTFEDQVNKINKAVKASRMVSAKRKEEMDTGY